MEAHKIIISASNMDRILSMKENLEEGEKKESSGNTSIIPISPVYDVLVPVLIPVHTALFGMHPVLKFILRSTTNA